MLSSEQMKQILSALPDPVFILTRTGRYAGIFGGSDSRYYHDGSSLIGKSIQDVLNDTKAEWFITQINRALNVNYLQIVEYSLSGNDVKGLDKKGPDSAIWFEGRIQALDFQVDGEDAVLWVASNITKRHELEEGLRTCSETDALTGLWNRRYFEQAVPQEKKRAIRHRSAISLLILDIDYFKLINDTHGHKVGDSVLCEIAALMTVCTRESDVAVRWGGEEFTVLMPYTDLDSARNVAEKLRHTVESYPFAGGHKVTVSVGYTEWYFDQESIEQLICKADEALYLAKNRGRNRIECRV